MAEPILLAPPDRDWLTEGPWCANKGGRCPNLPVRPRDWAFGVGWYCDPCATNPETGEMLPDADADAMIERQSERVAHAAGVLHDAQADLDWLVGWRARTA